MIKQLVNRRWRWATALVLIGMAVMMRLGIWQLDRLEQRRAANAELAVALSAPPEPLAEALATADPDVLVDRVVTVTGRYDFEEQMVLLVQNWQGSAGVHLITPLVLADGVTAVLIDRGWVPDDALNNLAEFNEPTDITTVTGVVALPELLRGESVPPAAPQRDWYRVDVPAMARQLPYAPLDVYVKQLPPEDGLSTLPYQADRVIDLSEGSHLSYAIQWFIFSLMLGGGYLAYVRRHM